MLQTSSENGQASELSPLESCGWVIRKEEEPLTTGASHAVWEEASRPHGGSLEHAESDCKLNAFVDNEGMQDCIPGGRMA